jgi:hypothetical protein
MDSELTVADRIEIQDLVLGFADGVTMNDVAKVESVWAETGTWTIDPPKNFSLTGTPAELAGPIAAMPQRWSSFVQLVYGTTATGSGDAATARSYITEVATQAEGAGTHFNYAIYEDELVRTTAGWRFRTRRYRYLYIDERPLGGVFSDYAVLRHPRSR